MPDWMRAHVGGEPSQWSPLVKLGLSRGLCPTPNLLVRNEEDYDTFLWHVRPRGDIPVGASVFTDGSLIDASWESYQALGWAFIAIDDDGEILAAAFGVPPKWVDSIQGAELWAVRMALQSVLLPNKLYTDCQEVQRGVCRGVAWAQSARRRYSRIWSALYVDLDEGAQAETIQWMPAHTSASSVDAARCSDGTVLSETMRCANAIVDLLAKQATDAIAISQRMREGLEARFAKAKDLAIFVGRLTFAAGAHRDCEGVLCRDSVGFDAAIARGGRKPKPTRVAPEPLPPLEQRSPVVAAVAQRIRARILARSKGGPESAG